MSQRPSVRVAVLMEREHQPNRWEDWRHRIAEVLPDEGAFGTEARLLRDDGKTASFLFPGFELELFKDESEGYYLNLSAGTPVWFVMWRVDDEDPSRARPEIVSVSYNEAGRWLDAQERVDNVPLHPRCATGCRPTWTSTTGPSPRSASARSRSSAPRSAGAAAEPPEPPVPSDRQEFQHGRRRLLLALVAAQNAGRARRAAA
jgi:hypothetical protein